MARTLHRYKTSSSRPEYNTRTGQTQNIRPQHWSSKVQDLLVKQTHTGFAKSEKRDIYLAPLSTCFHFGDPSTGIPLLLRCK
jgi:hypothetical protein